MTHDWHNKLNLAPHVFFIWLRRYVELILPESSIFDHGAIGFWGIKCPLTQRFNLSGPQLPLFLLTMRFTVSLLLAALNTVLATPLNVATTVDKRATVSTGALTPR
jgi:hypothetical protein